MRRRSQFHEVFLFHSATITPRGSRKTKDYNNTGFVLDVIRRFPVLLSINVQHCRRSPASPVIWRITDFRKGTTTHTVCACVIHGLRMRVSLDLYVCCADVVCVLNIEMQRCGCIISALHIRWTEWSHTLYLCSKITWLLLYKHVHHNLVFLLYPLHLDCILIEVLHFCFDFE